MSLLLQMFAYPFILRAFVVGILVSLCAALLGVSLVLTLLMLHTGCIAVPIAAHLAYNLLAFVPARLPLGGSVLTGAALIALVGWMIIRQPKMACLPMKWLDRLIAGAALAVLALQYFV